MLVCSVGSHLRCLRTCYMAHFTEQSAVPAAWGFALDADLAVKSSTFDSGSDLSSASLRNSTVNLEGVAPPTRPTCWNFHARLHSSDTPCEVQPGYSPTPCQTGFSCGDDFWFHNGLLPERGGERGQTYQLRDRETAAARQERCEKGAQAASSGWVWKGWPLITTPNQCDPLAQPHHSCPWTLRWLINVIIPFCVAFWTVNFCTLRHFTDHQIWLPTFRCKFKWRFTLNLSLPTLSTCGAVTLGTSPRWNHWHWGKKQQHIVIWVLFATIQQHSTWRCQPLV